MFIPRVFRSVRETEEEKKKKPKPTKQQTNMLHTRTWPESPSTALGWYASAWPWIFPSLFPPCSVCPAHRSCLSPVPPLSPRPGTGPEWLCPVPPGWVAFPSSKRSKSPCLTGHVASRWQPFLSSGAVPAPCTGSIEPKPALSPSLRGCSAPQHTPALLPPAFTPLPT